MMAKINNTETSFGWTFDSSSMKKDKWFTWHFVECDYFSCLSISFLFARNLAVHDTDWESAVRCVMQKALLDAQHQALRAAAARKIQLSTSHAESIFSFGGSSARAENAPNCALFASHSASVKSPQNGDSISRVTRGAFVHRAYEMQGIWMGEIAFALNCRTFMRM